MSAKELGSDGFKARIEELGLLNLVRNRNPYDTTNSYSSPLKQLKHIVHRIAVPYIELHMAHAYSLSFDLYYNLQVILSHGFMTKYAVTDELIRLLTNEREDYSIFALQALFYQRKRIVNVVEEVKELLPKPEDLRVQGGDSDDNDHSNENNDNNDNNNQLTKPLPSGCLFVRKVLVTPTRILFLPQTV